jgi:hypothetical protein
MCKAFRLCSNTADHVNTDILLCNVHSLHLGHIDIILSTGIWFEIWKFWQSSQRTDQPLSNTTVLPNRNSIVTDCEENFLQLSLNTQNRDSTYCFSRAYNASRLIVALHTECELVDPTFPRQHKIHTLKLTNTHHKPNLRAHMYLCQLKPINH